MNLTIHSFFQQFPDETSCFATVFQMKYPQGITCRCGKTTFTKIKKRPVYQCSCGYQISILKGTLFEHTSLPLQYWFYALFLFSGTKTGVSAKHLQRVLGISYAAAYRMGMKIRTRLTVSETLSGSVEIDEMYLKPRFPRRWVYWRDTAPVIFGMVERNGKTVIKHVRNNMMSTLSKEIDTTIAKGSRILSDSYTGYDNLRFRGYRHETVLHAVEFVHGDIHTQTIESMWGNIKRGIGGSYRYISPKNLQWYLNEYAWRYNHRKEEGFSALLKEAVEENKIGSGSI